MIISLHYPIMIGSSRFLFWIDKWLLMYVCVYICMCIYSCMQIYVYVYVYIYILLGHGAPREARRAPAGGGLE